MHSSQIFALTAFLSFSAIAAYSQQKDCSRHCPKVAKYSIGNEDCYCDSEALKIMNCVGNSKDIRMHYKCVKDTNAKPTFFPGEVIIAKYGCNKVCEDFAGHQQITFDNRKPESTECYCNSFENDSFFKCRNSGIDIFTCYSKTHPASYGKASQFPNKEPTTQFQGTSQVEEKSDSGVDQKTKTVVVDANNPSFSSNSNESTGPQSSSAPTETTKPAETAKPEETTKSDDKKKENGATNTVYSFMIVAFVAIFI